MLGMEDELGTLKSTLSQTSPCSMMNSGSPLDELLGNVRKAMNPAGRLLLVEMVLPSADTPHPGKMARHDDARQYGRVRSEPKSKRFLLQCA
jgi:hypothetical protein